RIAADARSDERDLPRAVRNRHLALVLEEGESVRTAVERAGDDVHGASAFRRRIAEGVLELSPDALVQVPLLRNDVREIECGRVVAVRRGAIERARHVAAVEAAVGVVRREDLLVTRERRV